MTQENAEQSTPVKEKTIAEVFHGLVESIIDEKGMEIPYAACLLDSGGYEIVALAIHPDNCYDWLVSAAITRTDIKEIMLGIDRYTKPDQGNEFSDTIAGVHWKRSTAHRGGVTAGFVIDYTFGPPKIVRPVNYENSFWNELLGEECKHFAQKMMDRVRNKMQDG